MVDILSVIQTGIESIRRALISQNFVEEYGYDGSLLPLLLTQRKYELSNSDCLTILSYSAKAQFILQRKGMEWSPAMLVSRGIVFNQNGEVVLFPFHKFFNLGEHPVWGDPNRFTNIVSVTEKIDGLMIQFCWYRGELISASRHRIYSPPAKTAKQMLEEGNVRVPEGYTLICELVHKNHPPPNPARVRYSHDGLYLLFLRDMRGLGLIPASLFYSRVSSPVFFPKQYLIGSIEEARAAMRENGKKEEAIEGIVVQSSEGRGNLLLKIKSLQYLQRLSELRELSARSIIRRYRENGASGIEPVIWELGNVNWIGETEAGRVIELILSVEEKIRREVDKYRDAKSPQDIPEPMRWVWGYREQPHKIERAIRHAVADEVKKLFANSSDKQWG